LRVLAVVVALTSAGCLADKAQRAFSVRYGCPEDGVQVEDLGDGRFRVSGCNDSALFRCDDDACREPRAAAPREEWTTSPGRAQRAVVKTASDSGLVSLDLQFAARTTLKLRAVPSSEGDRVQLKLERFEREPSLFGCRVDLMVNAAKLTLPAPVESRDKGRTTLLVRLSRDIVRDFAVAEELTVRACSTRWELDEYQVRGVRDFAMRYEKELAWATDATQSGAGMAPPTGGWVAWKGVGRLPAAVRDGAILEASDLFKSVAGSVVRVEGVRSDGISQGSGVAVSRTQVATNCHVLAGAIKLVVKQDEHEWVARLQASAPKQDRCLLAVEEADLVPIRGVRRYSELVVGEKLYTVGAPNGLDLTLADGLLSALREDGGVSYVQTTAPISPGSSGGPLFDARGNLVGITTLVLVGKQRINQALNFAIAADAYWAP
jgi:hypothetical protein